MKEKNRRMRRLLLGTLGWVLLSGLGACHKKDDPAVANAGGGPTNQRVVLTMKGAAQ